MFEDVKIAVLFVTFWNFGWFDHIIIITIGIVSFDTFKIIICTQGKLLWRESSDLGNENETRCIEFILVFSIVYDILSRILIKIKHGLQIRNIEFIVVLSFHPLLAS